MQLRPTGDIKRLFSALGEGPEDESADDLVFFDEEAMLAPNYANADSPLYGLDLDAGPVALSILVAMATGWSAIRGYERNDRSVGWGLTWAALGFLMPLPALAATALISREH